MVHRTINDPGYFPTVSYGFGISCETVCSVTGNVVDTAAGMGINIGHNNTGANSIASGNLVFNAPFGIVYSTNSGSGQLSVSSSFIQGATTAGIIAISYNDTTGTYAPNGGAVDYGNQYDAQKSNLFVGNNRAV